MMLGLPEDDLASRLQPAGQRGLSADTKPLAGRPNRRGAASGPANYEFGRNYWVVAMVGGEPVPVRVETGLTDLAYSEIIAGLDAGDSVLLLPSSSLFEQQARLQQFISERFSSTPFQQQQQGGGPRRRGPQGKDSLFRGRAAVRSRVHAPGRGR
jgi:hypothetical protein